MRLANGNEWVEADVSLFHVKAGNRALPDQQSLLPSDAVESLHDPWAVWKDYHLQPWPLQNPDLLGHLKSNV